MSGQTVEMLKPVKIDSNWGYINNNEQVIIQPVFDLNLQNLPKQILRSSQIVPDRLFLSSSASWSASAVR